MKARNVTYWISTVIVAFVMVSSIVGVLRDPDAVAGMRHLGYPTYFLVIVSSWKVLGGLALLAPKLPRLKEWAYAGAVFDFTGASISHASVGDDLAHVLVPLLLVLVLVASWTLRPPTRVVGRILPAAAAVAT